MAQLYFRYSTMNSGKTLQLLTVAHNYEEQNKKILIFKPSLDIRSSKSKIESRVGLSHECIDINEKFNILEYICENYHLKIQCILIDECQFLTKEQVEQLTDIVDRLDIPTICYGLKNSYSKGKLFEGSEALLYYSDKIEELKNICTFCNRKATMNLRIVNGNPIYEGEPVHCGDTKETKDYYIPTCRKHYFKPILNKDKES